MVILINSRTELPCYYPILINTKLIIRSANPTRTMGINDNPEITKIAIGDKTDKEGVLYTISIWAKDSILIDIINDLR